jgi:hypothetical protein
MQLRKFESNFGKVIGGSSLEENNWFSESGAAVLFLQAKLVNGLSETMC